jgi:hypothetical protein
MGKLYSDKIDLNKIDLSKVDVTGNKIINIDYSPMNNVVFHLPFMKTWMWIDLIQLGKEYSKFKGYHPGMVVISSFCITDSNSKNSNEEDWWKHLVQVPWLFAAHNKLCCQLAYNAVSDPAFLHLFKHGETGSLAEICIMSELARAGGNESVIAAVKKMENAAKSIKRILSLKISSMKNNKDKNSLGFGSFINLQEAQLEVYKMGIKDLQAVIAMLEKEGNIR